MGRGRKRARQGRRLHPPPAAGSHQRCGGAGASARLGAAREPLKGGRVRDPIITTKIGGFWNLAKRGINGTYFSVLEQHMQSYLNEFEIGYHLRKHRHVMLELLLVSFPRGIERPYPQARSPTNPRIGLAQAEKR
ncbi:MAG: hypothetical protein EON92_12595 [Burkholderiales bacterium]|nr:MAG: hypothetical protein EON92_12595 [Burkholderiales bacterium]